MNSGIMDVISKPIELVALLLLLLCTQPVGLQLRRGRDSSTGFRCIEEERDALLDFKSGLDDPGNRLSSWVTEDNDCCRWAGVRCNNRTGHVVGLHLRPPQDFNELSSQSLFDNSIKKLGGEIRPSLLDLTHLKHLDLSMNDFMIGIPVFLGSFKELRYLNLSEAGFNGMVPPELGNLSTLQHLDLSNNLGILEVKETRWLSRLISLQHLDMSKVMFQEASSSSHNWLHALNMLPSILEIRLSYCDLDAPLSASSLPHHNNFTSLSILDLRGNDFNSTIPEWLCNLTSLTYLDLSWNQFYGHIPAALGSMTSLEYLDLSGNDLLEISKTLANLCNLSTFRLSYLGVFRFLDELQEVFTGCMSNNLEILDLSYTNLTGRFPDWVGGLRNLRILDMSGNQISGSILASLGNLVSLQSLNLRWNKLTGSIPVSLGNLVSLQSLDLYENQLTGSIPASLGNLVSLQSLDLEGNKLTGSIPASLGNLVSLQSLHLEGNKLTGSIPASLGNLVSLQILFLYGNKFTGNIPKTLGRLSNLTDLYLGSNNLEGIMTEEHFMNLANLKSIDISGNPSLALKVSTGWNPPFRLDNIYMGSCLLGPQFPAWLRTQENYTDLDMSNARISDTIPDWFWNLSTQFDSLNISHNKISGKLQSLTSNHALYLDLSDNLFSGPIPPSIWVATPYLVYLDLSMNYINGTIPLYVCKSTEQIIINLSNNFLSGELPKCWENTSLLQVMVLSNNSLSGELPFALSNCTQLRVLDLSYNRFTGSIPPEIGQSLPYLMILSLNSNMLSGTIPSQLSNLSALQILDLSHNQLSGFIPQSFGDFAAMQLAHKISGMLNTFNISWERVFFEYEYSLTLTMKGRQLSYDSQLLSIVVAIDLSDNSLSGTIPKEVGNLIGLESLNLSGNQLSGEIINELGELRQLETLDLSKNKLSGKIPASLSDIYFLSHLNLSYNNLTGRIPSGEQLQTLNDPSSYIGNDDLCGPPLIKKCPGDETPPTIGDGFSIDEETEESHDIIWIYSGMAPGYVVGLLAFFGLLVLKRKWRIAYFRFIDYIYDTIYVAIAININKLKRGMPKICNHGLARRN